MVTKKKTTKIKRRERKNVEYGVAHIRSTFNNTIISIADDQGNVISWSSSGNIGFKGSRKSTPFAAGLAAEAAAKVAVDHGMKQVEVFVKGPAGRRRPSAPCRLQGWVNMIKDVTPIPHNGCRPSKRRRV